jgi:hypothetical protein
MWLGRRVSKGVFCWQCGAFQPITTPQLIAAGIALPLA